MEYLKVVVPGKKKRRDIDVLINGEKNGKAGTVIILSRGFLQVSVDLPGAEVKEIDLRNTTPSHPLVAEIRVGIST
jgi:hypothetical protein